jgi:hypothetical protein
MRMIGEDAVFAKRVFRRGWMSAVMPQQIESWAAGYAVRREWWDGSHEFVGFHVAWEGADRFVRRDRAYWRRGPWRPARYGIVVISRRDFDLHARRHVCQAPDCPVAVDPATVARSGR